MILVGTTISNYNEINGLVMNLKDKYYRFSIWTKTKENKEMLLEIGKFVKNTLKLPEGFQLVFQVHENALKRNLNNEYIMAI